MTKLGMHVDPASSVVARNTLWSLLAEASRLTSAFGVFLVLTHVYEVATYGILVGTIALMAFVLPWSSVGAGYLLLERVAGDSWDPGDALRQATGAAFVGGSIASLVLVGFGSILFPQASVAVLATIAFSELVANAAIECCLFLAQATERLKAMAAIRTVMAVARLVAALGLLLVIDDPPLWVWTALLSTTGLVTLLGAELTLLGRFVVPGRPNRADVTSGLAYSVGFGAQKLWENADSSMLVRYDRTSDAGIHGAASRLVWMATAPVFALLSATNSRIFTVGHESSASARRLAARVTVPASIYGVAVGLLLFVSAPWIVAVLPDAYVGAESALRWLSVLPALLAVGVFAATALTAIGHNRHRIRLMVLTATLNIVLNAALIPSHGWRGAVTSTLTTQVVFVVAIWWTLWTLSGREPRSSRRQEKGGSRAHL